eukprot:CAMPEP_0172784010 /NCGR_PEP_ID=MMETSP1074-20121228/204727_1 /TAXON_ID=2916 /ORGANISM="Ceratium fusus, Strain PA161109" /LENGTH=528 /DNA_ID=CAMNT_0013621009 /DNA_START=108 /DNA_END=1694 /DNA_ORIENTATION=+
MHRSEPVGSSWQREFATDPLDEGKLPMRLLKLSRIMARVLRHSGPEVGLVIGPDGWCPLSAVMQIDEMASWSKEDVFEVVEESFSKSRPRFEVKDGDGADEHFIRATHKHSFFTRGQQQQQQQRPPPRVVPPPVRAKAVATPMEAIAVSRTPIGAPVASHRPPAPAQTDLRDPLKNETERLSPPPLLSVQSVATPQRQPCQPIQSAAQEEDPFFSGKDPWAKDGTVANVTPKPSPQQIQQARAKAEPKPPPPQLQGKAPTPVANHVNIGGPNPPPQMPRAAEATPELLAVNLGSRNMPGPGAPPAVVAPPPPPPVPVGKPPPPLPPPGPPPPQNAAVSLASATRFVLAKAASKEQAAPVSDGSVAGNNSTMNPVGNWQGSPPQASPVEYVGSTSPKDTVPQHVSANSCDSHGDKAVYAAASASSEEPEKGLAEAAADGAHDAIKEDREASSDGSSSLTNGSGDTKVVSSLQRTWEQYSLPDGGFWWSTADSTSWFVESSPHPWEKYKIPNNEKCYWWNRDTEEFFLLQ